MEAKEFPFEAEVYQRKWLVARVERAEKGFFFVAGIE